MAGRGNYSQTSSGRGGFTQPQAGRGTPTPPKQTSAFEATLENPSLVDQIAERVYALMQGRGNTRGRGSSPHRGQGRGQSTRGRSPSGPAVQVRVLHDPRLVHQTKAEKDKAAADLSLAPPSHVIREHQKAPVKPGVAYADKAATFTLDPSKLLEYDEPMEVVESAPKESGKSGKGKGGHPKASQGRPNIWDMAPINRKTDLWQNRYAEGPSEESIKSPQGMLYKPEPCPNIDPKILKPWATFEFVAAKVNYKTDNEEYRTVIITDGIIPRKNPLYAEFVTSVLDYGFVSVSVERKGFFLLLCGPTGVVVIVKKKFSNIDAKLELPNSIRGLLENPHVFKTGYDMFETQKNLTEHSESKTEIRHVFDLRWGYPIVLDAPLLNFDSVVDELKDIKYPLDQHKRDQFEPYLPNWNDMHPIWKLYLIQKIRMTSYLTVQILSKYAERRGVSDYSNFMEYGRLLLTLLHQVRAINTSKCPTAKDYPELGLIWKRDPYFIDKDYITYKVSVADVETMSEHFAECCPRVSKVSFQNWNRTKHFPYGFAGRCQLCYQKLDRKVEHDCRLKNGLYGDGVYCEYPL